MSTPLPQASQGSLHAPEVGDHLALDLLNTEARSQGDVVDFWTTNEEVHRWLVQHGVVPATPHFETPLDLLARGRGLRAAVRKAVSARKARDPIAVEALNEYLQAYLTTPLVLRDETGALVLTRIARGDTVFSMLGPVAEAAAQLLVEDDFSLIKQCEHPDCILWFYDRTRSHKRRWCSMARCGNRHKAAQFRKRSSAE